MLMKSNIPMDHLLRAENGMPSSGSLQWDTNQPLRGRVMLIGRLCLASNVCTKR